MNCHGISVSPIWTVAAELKNRRLRVVLPEYELPGASIYALFPANRQRVPRVRVFVEHLIKSFGRADWETVRKRWVA